MPQVKELKELGVAGSATNEGRYEAVPEQFGKSFVSAPFMSFGKMLQVTKKTVARYAQRLLHVASKDCCRLTCNRLL